MCLGLCYAVSSTDVVYGDSGYRLFAHRAMRDAVQKRYLPTAREAQEVWSYAVWQ